MFSTGVWFGSVQPYSSGIQEGFTAFSVDFCADFLPNGTYLSIGCWKMDISELEQKYDQVSRDGHVAGYAGVQTSFNGSTNTIMSLWDIYYVDDSGQERTLRPELVYALNSMDSGEFSGEGTGAHCIALELSRAAAAQPAGWCDIGWMHRSAQTLALCTECIGRD